MLQHVWFSQCHVIHEGCGDRSLRITAVRSEIWTGGAKSCQPDLLVVGEAGEHVRRINDYPALLAPWSPFGCLATMHGAAIVSVHSEMQQNI